MKAQAIDILDNLPPLDLSEYSHIELCGLTVEIRDGALTIRNPKGGRLIVQPSAANQIEVLPK